MDSLEWNMDAFENWYMKRFLGDHKGEVQTGLQLPLEVVRGNGAPRKICSVSTTPPNLNCWRYLHVCGTFFISFSCVLGNFSFLFYEKHGIAELNPDYVPFELTPALLKMNENEFQAAVKAMQPEITIIESERWRIFSFDELRLKLSTHDEGGGGTSRNCERVIRFSGTSGEVFSAKSSCTLSGLGGSFATFEPIPALFCFGSSGVDPSWMMDAPTTTIAGEVHKANYFCNPKGSVVPEMLMSHLKFIDKVREAKGRPDASVMALMDGVQTHVTPTMLEFFALNKLICALRPPNTSHAVQNEDLVTFWQF
jgi:hypothetical protein